VKFASLVRVSLADRRRPLIAAGFAVALLAVALLMAGLSGGSPAPEGPKRQSSSAIFFAAIPAGATLASAEPALKALVRADRRVGVEVGSEASAVWMLIDAQDEARLAPDEVLLIPGRNVREVRAQISGREFAAPQRDGGLLAPAQVRRTLAGTVIDPGPRVQRSGQLLLKVDTVGAPTLRVERVARAEVEARVASAALLAGGIGALALLAAALLAAAAAARRDGALAFGAAWVPFALALAAVASGHDVAWLDQSAAVNTSLRWTAIALFAVATLSWVLALTGQHPAAGGMRTVLQFATVGWLLIALVAWLVPSTMHAAGGAMHRTIGWAPAVVLMLAVSFGAATGHRLWRGRRRGEQLRVQALESDRKYRHVYHSVPVALVSIDGQGQVLRWNDMADELFARALHKGRVNAVSAVLGPEQARTMIDRVLAEGRFRSEMKVDDPHGRGTRTFAIEALACGSAIEVTFVDVSERSQLAETLEHMAHHDFLTDLLNRRGLERQLDRVPELVRAGTTASIIYIDLDRFKAINDVFGHAAGDAVVIEVARRLSQALPDDAFVGRIGGDEFLVLLPGHDLARAKALAGALAAALSGQCYTFENLRFDVEASMGVIEATPATRPRELIAYADEACSQSKKGGRGRITALQPGNELLGNYRTGLKSGSRLKSDLPLERMCLYAQPIVSLKGDHDRMSYEVLLRSRNDKGIVEPPARLIAAAQRHGGMAAIDRYVLKGTVEHLARHPDHSGSLGFVSVNLSGTSLNDERFLRDTVGLLRDHQDAASKICLEITESIALYDVQATQRFISQMQAIGVRIALDDFGAGYTSFAYLKELPASLLKIDGQFIVGLASEPKHRGIIRAIQQLGRELGMECVAEWVEDVATLRALLELDVDHAQGFVFARPQPLEAWLEDQVDLLPLAAARRHDRPPRVSVAAPRGAAAEVVG
jgi:diguanylate cyclase (GGDEF)-like protein